MRKDNIRKVDPGNPLQWLIPSSLLTYLPTYLSALLQGSFLRATVKSGNKPSPKSQCCRTSSQAAQREGFRFKYYLVPKKNREWRLILELRSLNRYVKTQRFSMVTLAAIIPFLDQGDCFSALDLLDAYLNIMIQPSHSRFRRFLFGQDHFHYKVLPFSLSSAPRMFLKNLSVVAARLCKLGIVISICR